MVHSGLVFQFQYANVAILYVIIWLVYWPFMQTIYMNGEVFRQPLEPACQNKCAVNVPRSSFEKFNSFTLDGSQVLFVHFSVYNMSIPQPSGTLDVLDPLNLVWVKSIEAPFLSLDLGFNVYSFTTLSRVVHHTTVKVEVESLNCMKSMSYSCVVANLARTYLSNVTKQRGVMCYTVNDMNTVNYRCCKGNVHTQQVECDIPAGINPQMSVILIAITSLGAFAILCFPTILDFVPEEEESETLSLNTQVHNPLFEKAICTVQTLRNYSSKYYCGFVMRKLLIGVTLSMLYCIDSALVWYTKTYDLPKMFDGTVTDLWVETKLGYSLLFSLLYGAGVLCFSLFPRSENLDFSSASARCRYNSQILELISLIQQEKGNKVNWLTPYNLSKDYFMMIFKFLSSCGEGQSSFFKRFATLLGCVFAMLLWPVSAICIFILYTWYISPLGRLMRPFLCRVFILSYWASNRKLYIRCLFLFVLGLVMGSVLMFGYVSQISLILSAKLIVYLWIGLVSNKEYFFPFIPLVFICVYYPWNCLSSVSNRYRSLLEQTFEKCEQHQRPQPSAKKALTFDDKGVPRISSELFQMVIDKILPRSEVYTIMFVKLAMIAFFLTMTFSSIMVFGTSNLDQSSKALAVSLTGLVPKLVEIFGEGSYSRKLLEIENACRVERIVKDFLSQNSDTKSLKDESCTVTIRSSDDEEPSPSGDQPSETHVNARNEPSLEEPVPILETAHSKNNSERSSASNGRRREDRHMVVVCVDVNPSVQSINSCDEPSDDPSTERTPLLLPHRGKKERKTEVL